MATAKISQKWQINIPVEIREWLGLATGEYLEFVREKQRIIVTAKRSKISNLRGAVPVEGEQNFPEIIEQARLEMANDNS